jgi:hypothetical protein
VPNEETRQSRANKLLARLIVGKRHYCAHPHKDRSAAGTNPGSKLFLVVIFFEVLLALAAVAIIAFSLYVVYRLVTDES